VVKVADELREQLSTLTSTKTIPANKSLADQANQRVNDALAAQKAEREAQAAKAAADQMKEVREIEEGIKAIELQRRAQFGTSPNEKGGIVVDAKSRLTVPGTEQTTRYRRSDDEACVEYFDEPIKLGQRIFNAVRLSCPQSSKPMPCTLTPPLMLNAL
jgi:hypothetical protein